MLSSLGILVASFDSAGETIDAKKIVRKIVLFAPFQAFVAALLLNPFAYPDWLGDLLKRLGATLVPVALVAVGYQLQMSQVGGKARALGVGLAFKLVLARALILLLYAGLLRLSGDTLRVTVFEAAMAPMIGASIVAIDHQLDPPLMTPMVGVGIPLSFLTLPAWWRLLDLL